jgi:photosystem II stability/assembly factor-like uncharacterized protein
VNSARTTQPATKPEEGPEMVPNVVPQTGTKLKEVTKVPEVSALPARSASPIPPPAARERKREAGAVTAVPEILGADSRWEAIVPTSLPAERWVEMQFIDVLTGWIGGEGGSVCRTNDGGRSWTEVEIETRGRILGLTFINWNSGWVLAATDSNLSVDLFLTKDGGRRWKKIGLTGIERLYRVDERRGWAIGPGPRLLRTEDGGETWVSLASPPNSEPGARIELVDLSTVTSTGEKGSWRGSLWVVGNLTKPGGTRPGGLWRSDDGGASWVRVTLPPGMIDRVGRFLSVRFEPGGRGWVSGEVADASARRWFLLETTDGGLNWKIDFQSGRELERARFGLPPATTPASDGDSGARPGGFGGLGWTQTLTIEADKSGSSSHVEAHLLVTSDGGRTWVDEFRLLGRHQMTGFFIGRDLGWVLTDGGVLLRSGAAREFATPR